MNSPYSYDKSPSMDISPPHSYSPIPQSIYSQNGLPSPQKSMSPGYESPYGHRDLLSSTSVSTRLSNGTNGAANPQAESPSSPPHSYSPLPHVYGQNGQARQNGSNVNTQNITIATSAPSPSLSAQSGSMHSPNDQQQIDKLWNGKLMDSVTSNSGHNGSQSFVQISQHHLQHQQQPQQQQQQSSHHQQHIHNQNSREILVNAPSPSPSTILQRVRHTKTNFLSKMKISYF